MTLLELLNITHYKGLYKVYIEDNCLNIKEVVNQFADNSKCERGQLFFICKPYLHCEVERLIITTNNIKIIVNQSIKKVGDDNEH